MHGEDLRGADLTEVKGLLPEHLARADLTGARLPDDVAKFPALRQVAAISGEARKIFIGLLAACFYSWLVIGTTTDVALILNTASSPLPIINTPIPIAGFYVVGAVLLAAVYCYFHFYLQRLWRTLATLPAIFPDGRPLDEKTDPWLLTNLVRAEVERLRQNAPPLTHLENLLTVLLAWWLVPLTLLWLWAEYLPAHDWLGTTCLVALIGITALFGRHSYRLAGATLRSEPPATAAEGDDGRRAPGHAEARWWWCRAWRDFGQIRPDGLTVRLTAVLIVCSLSSFRDNPRDPYTWVAKGLNAVGIRTYADLREVDIAVRPEGWTGQEWDKVKQVDLHGRNLAFADATSAFLPNADLRGANLTSAILEGAELQGAVLYDDDRHRHAQLQGADLRRAQLQGANLRGAQLQGADLREAQLQGANLVEAQLQGANLAPELQSADLIGKIGHELQDTGLGAQLQGADLLRAQLQGANLGLAQLQGARLRYAGLQGANLSYARLQGAELWGAQLQGADLYNAQLQGASLFAAFLEGAILFSAELQGADLRGTRLQGADLSGAQLQGAYLRGTQIWRATVSYALWDLADLRLSNVWPMTDSDIDTLISAATERIPDAEHQRAVAESLNERLRTAELPARPDFPEEWRSEPNVMFSDSHHPEFEPFDWGPRKWATERAYNIDLAKFLGDLACDRDVHEAQTEGLVRRALVIAHFDSATEGTLKRVWPALFAKQVTGPDCPPAKGLPDDMRRELEELVARGDAAALEPEASPSDPIE